MKYPQFIKKGDTIGITAPSSGIVKESKLLRLDNAEKNIEKLGYRYIETKNVRTDEKGRSSLAIDRANQFVELLKNDDVKSIIMASGGDFLADILEFLDFENLKKLKPKWIQGYSDITTLSFLFTTILDIATIYGQNVCDYGMEPLFKNLTDSIKIMEGQEVIQESFEKYEEDYKDDNPYATYNLTKEDIWKNLNNEEKIHFKGRSIGGCFDCIINLIGTKYDKINEYIERYKQDGIIWFLEVYEMTSPQVYLHLLQMKNAGYFKNCKGIIFGRPLFIREDYDIKFYEAVKDALGDLNIPIIYDADIGHVSPQMAIVNGAILDIESKKGKGIVKTILEQ